MRSCKICKSPVAPYILENGMMWCSDCGSLYNKSLTFKGAESVLEFKWQCPEIYYNPKIILPRVKFPTREPNIPKDIKQILEKEEPKILKDSGRPRTTKIPRIDPLDMVPPKATITGNPKLKKQSFFGKLFGTDKLISYKV